jgi:hypothetical protein
MKWSKRLKRIAGLAPENFKKQAQKKLVSNK